MSRLATNEMSSGVFQLLFMQGFLWNAGIGWTIPNRTSCECLPLIKPFSCTNTLHPAQTASRIWFWSVFLSPLCRRHLEGGKEPFSLLTLWPCAAFAGQKKHRNHHHWRVICIYWTLHEGQCNTTYWCLKYFSWMAQWQLVQTHVYCGYFHWEIQSVKLQLVKAKMLHDKRPFLFPPCACVLCCLSVQLSVRKVKDLMFCHSYAHHISCYFRLE